MVPIPEGVERDDGEPDDDNLYGPRDVDGGVGGASFERGECPSTSAGTSLGGLEGDSASGGGDSRKQAEEEELEDPTSRPNDIEREIVELTKRLEEKQLAKKIASESVSKH